MPVVSCDPLRVWSRLEMRPRQDELDRPLEARVEDPLWLLTRQWQFGEFHGSDTGSAITATIARRISPLTQVTVGPNAATGYDVTAPLEPRVEQMPIDFPVTLRAQIGDHLMTLLGARLPAGAPLTAVRAVLREVFSIVVPAVAADDAVGQARHQLAGLDGRVTAALAGRSFDGPAFAWSLPTTPVLSDLKPELAQLVTVDIQAAFLAALAEFVGWFTGLYATPVPTSTEPSGWDGAKLEYDYQVATDAGLALRGTTSPSGRLDWYSFTVAGPAPVLPDTWQVTGSIPRPVTYSGMPAARWWQMEDAAVSLAQLRADSTDLVKIVVTEFALVFGNDWLVVPYDQPVGTLAQIGGVVVDDVFGVRTFVGPATGAAGSDWAAWDMFSLSPAREDTDVTPLGQHLFLPPVLALPQQGPVEEDVSFVRDEDANMVWAIEATIPDGLGGGRDGAQHAQQMTAALTALGPTPPSTPDPTANLRFVLGTAMPENWIPFVPVGKPHGIPAIQLQRAWTPRDFPRGSRVRPRTEILAAGIAADDSQHVPYYVNEEEVARAGTRVRTTMRRARWNDGTTVVWRGRTRSSGRGEFSSGLRFDVLTGPGASDS